MPPSILSGLVGPTSQFLNGTRTKLSELVLARMALLLDQSCSVPDLPLLRSANCGGKMYVRALDLSIQTGFSADRNRQKESDLRKERLLL